MSQLLTLVWLKWKLLRNSMRSTGAVANQIASVIGMLIAFTLALVVAIGLGVTTYVLTTPSGLAMLMRSSAVRQNPATATAEFIFFSILSFVYLMWATLPLSIGGSKQFDAGRLLIYPITLKKLFAVDYISELTTLQSVFAIPAIVAMSIGAGLGSGNLIPSLVAVIPAILFGVAISKWLGTTIGSLVRRKRARGEMVVAVIGAVAGLGGAVAGQVGPLLIKHADSIQSLRWTPSGAAAYLLGRDFHEEPLTYTFYFLVLSGYSILLIVGTYWVARRAAIGPAAGKKLKANAEPEQLHPAYTGWQIPIISSELSAVMEKELRYAMRNAQVRMMALMPLILIVIRVVNSRRFGSGLNSQSPVSDSFVTYGSGLIATGGVLYVFLILAGLSCNQFAFEEGGMRTLILSPIARKKILLGKNLAVTVLALIFSTLLMFINGIVFGDLDLSAIAFAILSFIIFAAIISLLGNWFSIRFPKRMQFGKRLNVSGVAGLLLIPMILLLAAPPVLAFAVGYMTHSLLFEYATLASLAVSAVGLYWLMIGFQGRSLQRREVDILEAVKEPAD